MVSPCGESSLTLGALLGPERVLHGQNMYSMARTGIPSNPTEGAVNSCIQGVDKYVEDDGSIRSTRHSPIHSAWIWKMMMRESLQKRESDGRRMVCTKAPCHCPGMADVPTKAGGEPC